MVATLFNQPHERNMHLPEEIVPLSKIEDQNNESIMKIICKKAKCDEYRRYNKNFDEDDGPQLRRYMQEGDEIVAQVFQITIFKRIFKKRCSLIFIHDTFSKKRRNS